MWESCHEAGIYPLSYYPHNWHFLAACAALEGKGKRALEASRYMADFVVDQNLMYTSDWATLQHFYMIPAYIMVKFADWDAIMKEPKPDPELKIPNCSLALCTGNGYGSQGQYQRCAITFGKN